MSAAGRTADHAPALRNSGPGAGVIYRSGAVGTVHRLDLGAVLHAWDELPPRLRAPMSRRPAGADGPGRGHFAAPRKVRGVALFLLERLRPAGPTVIDHEAHEPRLAALDARRDDDARARAALLALKERLAGAGWLEPVHGIARDQEEAAAQRTAQAPDSLAAAFPWLPPGNEHRALRYAWLACAVSHYSPPLILWTREPSLAWWRGDRVILLRWLGAPR